MDNIFLSPKWFMFMNRVQHISLGEQNYGGNSFCSTWKFEGSDQCNSNFSISSEGKK